MIPIFKRGDKTKPESYRLIALLSHARKIIDSVLGLLIKQPYSFNECQTGFKEHTGVESAIIRHIANTEKL